MSRAHAVPGEPFDEVPVREKFFESSAFFPMPVVLASTRAPDGQTNLAPYSHVFPELLGADPALLLVARADSKTAANLMRTGRVSLSFIPDDPALLDNCQVLGRPAATADKMALSIFTLAPSPSPPGVGPPRPDIVSEAVQVFECSWDDTYTHAVDERDHERDHHFRLRVDAILLKRRWRQALEVGRGSPRLPVDYGYRAPTSSWLSRPRTYVVGPRLRPRFETLVPGGVDETVGALRRAIAAPGAPVSGAVSGHHVQLTVRDEERTFWSPQMDLEVEPHEEGSRLRARIGPHPHVWTLFVGLHAFVGFSGLGGVMYGLSQWTAGESPWALWALPLMLVLHAFIAGAAFIGQGLGADQTYQLRSFMDDVLAS